MALSFKSSFNFLLLTTLLIVASTAVTYVHANELSVRVAVDRNPVIVNESFNLTVTANEDLPRWAFSSQPLMRDFVVGSTSIDSSTQIVNGQAARTTRWTVRLTARQPGTYTIPSFTIEGKQTQPIELQVIAASSTDGGEQRPLFLKATVNRNDAYVQQQLIYRVELFLRANVPLEGGSITAPEGENLDVEQITQNRERQEIVDGTRYRVITQEYAVTPQRSGELTIKGARFDGIYRGPNTRSLTGFSRPEPVTLYADDIQLNVSPRIANFPGRWLVSEQVTIEEEWDPDTVVLPVGEPITRTVTITAEGVRPEQLPEPEPETQWPRELRAYPDRPAHESFTTRGTRITQSRVNTVIIPSRSGTYTIPAIEIPWFNSRTEQIEYASIPEREISVINPPGGIPSPRAVPDALSTEPEPSETQETQQQLRQTEEPRTAMDVSGVSTTVVLAISALWIVTAMILIGFVQHYRKKALIASSVHTAPRHEQRVPAHARGALNELKQACSRNQAREAEHSILAWQQARTKSPATFASIRKSFSQEQEFLTALTELEHALYSGKNSKWTGGTTLWNAVRKLHKRKDDDRPQSQTLYPH